MPVNSESLTRKLYDLLNSKGYTPKPLDMIGKITPSPEDATVIKFDFVKDRTNYGKVWVSIDRAKTLIVYYGDSVSDSPDSTTTGSDYDDTWTGLLSHLKNWAQRRQLGFELKNENHLESDMAKRNYTAKKENISEASTSMADGKSISSFIITAKTAEGDTKKYRVMAQNSDMAKEKFSQHHSMAKILDVSEEGVAEGSKRKKKKTSRSSGRYFFPGYGYYGGGESGEAGGDGVGESANKGKVGTSGNLKGALWRVEQDPSTGRFFVVKGYHQDRKIWKNQIGAGDFSQKQSAEDKVAELNNGMAEGQETMKQVKEGYYPMGKQGSYSDAVPTTKIVIQHSRRIEEGEQRYRNIAKIFVENADGERFAVPTIKPGIARVYARHIAEGGTPYDERGKHITSLVEEYSKMAGFVRATKGKQFNESAQQLVNEGLTHYQSLRESLRKMTGHRGYSAYFESWTPSLMEDGEEQTNLNELFVQETLDPRIESVMPILSRLHKKVNEMNEVGSLAEWAENIIDEAIDPESTDLEFNEDEENLNEARMAEADYMLQQIGSGEIDLVQILFNPVDPIEKAISGYLNNWMGNLAAQAGLDPQKDMKQVLSLLKTNIAKDHPMEVDTMEDSDSHLDEEIGADQKHAEPIGKDGDVGELVGVSEGNTLTSVLELAGIKKAQK